MRLIYLCAFVTLAAASRNHHIILLKTETPTTEYREEDSKGFYSYGYSSDDSAKAEYKTSDGSSKGFYSYVDSDGKLQTVKYEAGRAQGFTASATNLPTPPMDDSQAPEPVQDTPEVEMAKQAHFEAYREAALRAEMEPDNNEGGGDDGGDDGGSSQISSESKSSSENNLSLEQMSQLETELQQNTRELLLNRQSSREQVLLNLLREQHDSNSKESDSRERVTIQQLQRQHQPQLMTTYILNAEARVEQPSLSELRTIYRLASADSNVELRRGDFHLNGNNLQTLNLLPQSEQSEKSHQSSQEQQDQQQQQQQQEEDNLGSFESIRVPSNSYYTVNSPSTHYTVETPTVLTTLPRIVSIRLGNHRLPTSLSHAFSSQRLNGKSTLTSH